MNPISAQKRPISHKNRSKVNENNAKLLKTAKCQKTMQLLITQMFTSITQAEGSIKTNPIQTQKKLTTFGCHPRMS